MQWRYARHSPWLSLCLLLALSCGARGEDTISTDRPDFVESSLTMGKWRFEIETSVAQEFNSDGTTHETTWSTPTLLRLGFLDNWELRLETDGYIHPHTTDATIALDESQNGTTDVSVGLKWHMLDGEGSRPSVGWLLHADLPTGSSDFRGHGVRPSLRAVAEWELPGDNALGVMPGVMYDARDDAHRYTAGIFGITFAHEWTERLRSFVELAAHQLAKPEDGGNVITYDAGVAWLITPKVQLDAAVYVGANDHAPDFVWTVGLSVKF